MIKNKFVIAYLLTGTLFKVKQMKESNPVKENLGIPEKST